MHVRPGWCWPACVWSVYGHVVAAAVVLLVRGLVTRLLVGLFRVGSLALQRALAQSDLVRVGALLVSASGHHGFVKWGHDAKITKTGVISTRGSPGQGNANGSPVRRQDLGLISECTT